MPDLTVEIDRLTRQHAESCGACLGALPADSPDACTVCGPSWLRRSGSIYIEQAEREARMPGLGRLREVAERLEAPSYDVAPERYTQERRRACEALGHLGAGPGVCPMCGGAVYRPNATGGVLHTALPQEPGPPGLVVPALAVTSLDWEGGDVCVTVLPESPAEPERPSLWARLRGVRWTG